MDDPQLEAELRAVRCLLGAATGWAAFVALARFKLGVIPFVLVCGLAGLAWKHLCGLPPF